MGEKAFCLHTSVCHSCGSLPSRHGQDMKERKMANALLFWTSTRGVGFFLPRLISSQYLEREATQHGALSHRVAAGRRFENEESHNYLGPRSLLCVGSCVQPPLGQRTHNHTFGRRHPGGGGDIARRGGDIARRGGDITQGCDASRRRRGPPSARPSCLAWPS